MRTRIITRAVALIAALAFAAAIVPAALAAVVSAPLTVSDDVTHLKVSKFETGTHEWVSGAQMVIIEKDTQKIIAEWTTGTEPYVLEKRLDVDKPYILKEFSAPAGHDLANDVEFYVNASEAEGITIVNNGGDGNAELMDSITIALYDNATNATEDITRTERGSNTIINNASGNKNQVNSGATREAAPKTGDETPLWVAVVAIAIALVGAAALQILKRRKKSNEQ